MFNLIETQQALKGLPLPDVMKYANGNNPEVPAYLALSELQRRKQIEETKSAFDVPTQTVKQQIESGLTSLPQGQVNPTQMQSAVNPTTPPQLALSPTAAPPMVNPTAAPAGVNPAVAPPVPRMAQGGLSNLPLPHMFRQTSYANGGIVHFFEGTGDKTVEQAEKEQLASDREAFLDAARRTGAAALDVLSLPGRGVLGAINTGIRGARAVTGKEIPYIGKDPALFESMTPFYDLIRAADEAKARQQAKPVQHADASVYDREDAAAGKIEPNKVPPNPNKQASNTTSAQVKPPVAPSAPAAPNVPANPMLNPDQFKAPTELSDAQLLERRRALENLAGVSKDPMADIKKRYADLEAKRAGQEAEDPYNRLMERLNAFATAAPEKGLGYQGAVSSEAGLKMQREQEALRDKQASEMNALQLNIAKEEDARRRGDVTAVEAARAAQEKTKQDLMKLGIDASNATANQINAAANTLSSQAQMLRARHEASVSKTPPEIQLIERIQKDPDFAAAYEKTLGLKNAPALIKAAQTKWEESMALRMAWENKGGYPAYLASQGITMPSGGGANAPAVSPKEGDKATSNSGKPIIFKNGKWEYQ